MVEKATNAQVKGHNRRQQEHIEQLREAGKDNAR